MRMRVYLPTKTTPYTSQTKKHTRAKSIQSGGIRPKIDSENARGDIYEDTCRLALRHRDFWNFLRKYAISDRKDEQRDDMRHHRVVKRVSQTRRSQHLSRLRLSNLSKIHTADLENYASSRSDPPLRRGRGRKRRRMYLANCAAAKTPDLI